MLPRVIALAQEGLNAREIGEKLSMSKSTVSHWLRAIRPRRSTKGPRDPAEVLQAKITYYHSMSRELYDEWLRSKADKQVRVVEETGPAGDEAAARKKTTIRTETRSGNPALLAKSMEARSKAEAFQERLDALQGTAPAAPGSEAPPLPTLSDDDLQKLASDGAELHRRPTLRDRIPALRAKTNATASSSSGRCSPTRTCAT